MSPETIPIVLNGRPGEAPRNGTVQDLLDSLDTRGPGLAVAVNEDVVRREAYATVRLSPGDRVEIIQAVGGG